MKMKKKKKKKKKQNMALEKITTERSKLLQYK